MTEDQAKKKACSSNTHIFCLGQSCMAWRWNGYFNEDGLFMRRISHGQYVGQKDKPKTGYCGLAGRP